jgi:acetolactate synthase-1/2/3 large subunit
MINNNYGLGQSYRGIKMTYGETPGHPEDQYAFSSANLTNMAKEMGAFALRVDKAKDIGPAIQKALAADKPAVVEVLTDLLSDPQEY